MELEDRLRASLKSNLDPLEPGSGDTVPQRRARVVRNRRALMASSGIAAALVGVVVAAQLFTPVDDPTFGGVETPGYRISIDVQLEEGAPFTVTAEPSEVFVPEGERGHYKLVFRSETEVALGDERFTFAEDREDGSVFGTSGYNCSPPFEESEEDGGLFWGGCTADLRLLRVSPERDHEETIALWPGLSGFPGVKDRLTATGTLQHSTVINWDAWPVPRDEIEGEDQSELTITYDVQKVGEDEGEQEPVVPEPTPGQGLKVELIVPDTVVAGELFDIRLKVSDDEGRLYGLQITTGDGRTIGNLPLDRECWEAIGSPEPPVNETHLFPAAMRAEGTFMIEAEVTTGGCASESERRRTSTEITSLASGTPVPSNGPLEPLASSTHEYLSDEDPAVTLIDVGGSDEDGFISYLEFDWGDGSEPTVIERPLSMCEEEPTRWFRSVLTRQLSHRYETEGTFKTKVTVRSVDCDGGTVQEATDTRTISYPPPPGGGGLEGD